MIKNVILPENLKKVIGSEKVEFAVKPERADSPTTAFSLIGFAILWLTGASIGIITFLVPILQRRETTITIDKVLDVLGLLFLGLFVLIGIGVLVDGIYSLFKKGSYFVGTPTRLVICEGNNIRSIDWEKFSGDIKVIGSDQKGSISLRIRPGEVVSVGSDEYITEEDEEIFIYGISNAFEIEQICRRRIKENDPTPPSTISE